MQLRFLVLSWVPLSLVAKRVFAGTGLYQQETLHSEPKFSKAEKQLTKTGTAALFESSVATWEDKTDPIAGNAAEVSNEGAFEERGSGRLKKVPQLPVSLRRICFLLAVLLCVSLLTAVIKERAAATKQDEERMRETRARLQKIKALLPTAEKLSLVVGTQESRNLLKTLRETVGEKDTATEKTREVEKVETSLANALKALRRLHHAALREADATVQADKSVPELSTLGLPLDNIAEVLLDIEQPSEQQATRPLIRTYRSLVESAAVLRKRIQSIAERLSSQRLFKNEADEGVLLSTAAALEALRATSASRKRVAKVGQGMGKAALEAVKLRLISQRERALLDIEGDMQILRLSCALRRNAADAGEGSAAEQPPETGTKKAFLDALEKGITDVEGLLVQLRLNAEALRKSTSLFVATLRGRESFEAEKKARKLLAKCSDLDALLPSIPVSLDEKGLLMVKHMGTRNAESFRTESELLERSLQRMLKTMKKERSSFAPPSWDAFNKFLAASLVEQAKAIAFQANLRKDNTAMVSENLKKVKEVPAALEELTKSSINCLYQNLDRGRSDSLELSARLLAFLKDDVNHNTAQADGMASQISQLSGREISDFEKLQKDFKAAKRIVENARTLTAAADAAANMRANLFAMQELFFLASEEENRS